MPKASTNLNSVPDTLSNYEIASLVKGITNSKASKALTWHACIRMQERSVSFSNLYDALCTGKISPHSKDCLSIYSKANNLSVIVSPKGNKIVTAYFKGYSGWEKLDTK